MSSSTAKSSRGIVFAAIGVVIVLVIVVAGFVVPLKAETRIESVNYVSTQTAYIPIPGQTVTTVTSTSYSTVQSTFAVASTETQGVFGGSPETLNPTCGSNPPTYAFSKAYLQVGTDVQIQFSASDTVYVYVYSSSVYQTWVSNGASAGSTPSSYLAYDNAASGTLSFHVSATDTYYLLILDEHNGILCIGAHTVGILSVSGSAVFVTQSESTVTITNSQEIVQPETITTTSTSTETNIITTSSNTTTTVTVGLFDQVAG